MLKRDNRSLILNEFFSDPNCKGFQLRKLSRSVGVATPSVSKYLDDFEKNKLIIKKKDSNKGYPYYLANVKSDYFRFLKVINTLQLIKESGLLDMIVRYYNPSCVFLFGPSASGSDTLGDNLGLFIQPDSSSIIRKSPDFFRFESLIKRKINLLLNNDFSVLSPEVQSDVVNGLRLHGGLLLSKALNSHATHRELSSSLGSFNEESDYEVSKGLSGLHKRLFRRKKSKKKPAPVLSPVVSDSVFDHDSITKPKSQSDIKTKPHYKSEVSAEASNSVDDNDLVDEDSDDNDSEFYSSSIDLKPID